MFKNENNLVQNNFYLNRNGFQVFKECNKSSSNEYEKMISLIRNLMELYDKNNKYLYDNKYRYSIKCVEELLFHLIECNQLFAIRSYIKNQDDTNTDVFLDRLNYLEIIAAKTEYFFENADIISSFIRSYKILLVALDKQRIVLKKMPLETLKYLQLSWAAPNEKDRIEEQTGLNQAIYIFDFYAKGIKNKNIMN